MVDTFASRGITHPVIAWGPGGPMRGVKIVKANGVDLLPGYIVTNIGETGASVDLCGATEQPSGVIIGPVVALTAAGAKRNLDSISVDDESLYMAEVGSGIEIWVFHVTSAGAITPGLLAKVSATAGLSAPFAYADGTEENDSSTSIIGRFSKSRADEAAVTLAAVRMEM